MTRKHFLKTLSHFYWGISKKGS